MNALILLWVVLTVSASALSIYEKDTGTANWTAGWLDWRDWDASVWFMIASLLLALLIAVLSV